MKRISLIFILVLCLLVTGGCSKTYKFYENECNEFVDLFYEATTDGTHYFAFDLRSQDEYAKGHVRQMQNYDINQGSIDEFLTSIKGIYSYNHTLFLYHDEFLGQENINKIRKHYRHVKFLMADASE